MSFRSPLARAQGLGSAKEGISHWWMTRLTAVALIPLVAWVLFGLVHLAGADYLQVRSWVAHPVNSVALICLMLALAYHSSLGVHVVTEDYVRRQWLRRIIIVIVYFLKVLIAVTAIFAILKIALGADV